MEPWWGRGRGWGGKKKKKEGGSEKEQQQANRQEDKMVSTNIIGHSRAPRGS